MWRGGVKDNRLHDISFLQIFNEKSPSFTYWLTSSRKSYGIRLSTFNILYIRNAISWGIKNNWAGLVCSSSISKEISLLDQRYPLEYVSTEPAAKKRQGYWKGDLLFRISFAFIFVLIKTIEGATEWIRANMGTYTKRASADLNQTHTGDWASSYNYF